MLVALWHLIFIVQMVHNDEDKQSVLVLLDKMESLLTECEKAILEQWKIKNLNYST